MGRKNKDYAIHADAVIHFKTGATLRGDLAEFIIAEDTKSLRKLLQDPEFMQDLVDREVSALNLEEVAFISIQHVRVNLKEDTGGRHEEPTR